MNRRQTGTAYERRTGEYLKEQGYELIGYNFRCRQGEIDIIARDGRYLVFVEVKYRRDGQTGDPLEAVVKLAEFYEVSMDYLVGLTDEAKPYPRKKSRP